MPELPVVEQEVTAHVFVRLDSPAAEAAQAALWAMWDRFRQAQRADRPLGATTPAERPAELPEAPVHGPVTVAGVQDTAGLDQMIVRRDREVLNLSMLLGTAPGRTWAALERRMDGILGAPGPDVLGAAVLSLGKTADTGPSTLDLAEQDRGDDTRSLRRLRLVGRTGRDGDLSALAWSASRSDAMPVFVRYLMHMAAVRHQLRAHGRFARRVPQGGERPRAVIGVPYGDTDFRTLDTPEDRLSALRAAVGAAWENAEQALRHCEAHGMAGLADRRVLDDDRDFVHWFTRDLSDHAALLRLADGGGSQDERKVAGEQLARKAQPMAHGAGTRRPVRVLSVIDEWLPANGGVSALNRKLCIALVAAGAEVYVLLPRATRAERDDALDKHVVLVDAERPDLPGRESLMRRAPLPPGVVPDLVIGHGRLTGLAAKAQTEDHFVTARRLHFVHVEPNRNEWFKGGRSGDPGARAAQRTWLEFEHALGAWRVLPVGPRLEAMVARERQIPKYRDLTSVRIDPGFDDGRPGPHPTPAGVPQFLLMGRMQDDDGKGLNIASRALGRAAPERSEFGQWELLVRGALEDTSDQVHSAVEKLVDNPAIDVTVHPYTPELALVEGDLARSSLVLMPSRADSFGLVGVDAVSNAVPALISGRSGLGMLLRSVLPADWAEQVVVDVAGQKERLEEDVARWTAKISNIMYDLPHAFVRAGALQRMMAEKVTWADAAARVLGCADG
ncbi:CATRA conflict system CASPASE/TPR repeat-associated protein [Streptomyces sp. NPDC049040]|uniref:CATRA conflict system CASPASE/TPR repeat-associated protein n=1 Tax=Streptomyces sp. NPDC049040 TaxID=3365593 RepID=UPI00371B6988